MGPTESKHSHTHSHTAGHGGFAPGLGHAGAHTNEGEHTPVPACPGDLLEGSGPGWEAAWIDLGGEG
jgi:hypothetical protein